MSLDSFIQTYRDKRPFYDMLTNKLEVLFREILYRENVHFTIEKRTKEVESFSEKITRADKNYTNPLEEISDFSGIRIIVNSIAEIEMVVKLLEREFEIDRSRSINKAGLLNIDHWIPVTTLYNKG
ncbi:MAG: RelA/SpoT domain-containing protein [Syntrophomonas sp.]